VRPEGEHVSYRFGGETHVRIDPIPIWKWVRGPGRRAPASGQAIMETRTFWTEEVQLTARCGLREVKNRRRYVGLIFLLIINRMRPVFKI